MYKVENLKSILVIRWKFFINPPQDGQAWTIIILLGGSMKVHNAKWTLRQFALEFMEDIFLQPLSTYNHSCVRRNFIFRKQIFFFEKLLIVIMKRGYCSKYKKPSSK